MADKLNNGDIYTDAVGNNLVVVDPNKVMVNGKPKERLVAHEDLVMYANLTAIIYPRSKVISGSKNTGDKILIDIFDGEINFMKPKNSDFLNSDWTEAFTNPDINKKVKKLDKDGDVVGISTKNTVDFQGFGITSINVKLNSSYIPQVSINFTDVRGKTLFSQARGNTPYTAFFHLPYPTFYLTIKGYYGKAVKYQLTMEKFSSRFDPGSGDYLVTCNFIGNHVALLRDINMHQILTAPYMYPVKCDSSGCVTETRGKQVLDEVYRIYRKEGLIGDSFPVEAEMTLVELIDKLKLLDNDLGKLFGETSLQMTTDRLEYDALLKDLNKAVKEKDGWKDQYLGKGVTVQVTVPDETSTGKTVNATAYPLKGINTIPETADPVVYKDKIISEARDNLQGIINKFGHESDENLTFGKTGKYAVVTKLTQRYTTTYGPAASLFDDQTINTGLVRVEDTSNLDVELEPWILLDAEPATFGDLYLKHKNKFDEQAKKMSEEVSKVLNTRLEKAIGFKPTIRNVFAIIMAGADTFLRLLDIVHTNAMRQKSNPKRLKISKDSSSKDIVYPWPQYYVVEEEDECTTSSVLKYPGAEDVIENTGADNKKVWPEVYFVEEYTKTSVYKSADFNLQSNNEAYVKDFIPTSINDWKVATVPYNASYFLTLLWEIILRTQKTIRYGSLSTRFADYYSNGVPVDNSILELGTYDGMNLFNRVKNSYSLNEVFADVKNVPDLMKKIEATDPEGLELFKKSDTVVPQSNLRSYDFSYTELSYSVNSADFTDTIEDVKRLKNYNGVYDLAPTLFGGWVKANYANGSNTSIGDFYNIEKGLDYDLGGTFNLRDKKEIRYLTNKKYCFSTSVDTIVRFNDNPKKLSTDEKEFYSNIELAVTEGRIVKPDATVINPSNSNVTSVPTDSTYTSMLNTPYFMNAISNGVSQEQGGVSSPYVSAAYLFLNSLPLPTFREKTLIKGATEGETEFGGFISQLFNQVPAIHDLPVMLLLKLGSIWHRYKQNIETSSDILGFDFNDLGGPVGPGWAYDPLGGNINNSFTYTDSTGGPALNYNGGTTNFGVYQEIISSIQYIISGIYPSPVTVLNNIISPADPLTISQNPNISTSDSNFKFFDVSLDSDTAATSWSGAPIGESYYILYPSSGALIDTEIDNNPVNVNATINGGCRLLWGMSNYGYFRHDPNYRPEAHRYLKKVDNTKDQQEPWEFRPSNTPPGQDYSTIEELRGVFNKEQLDFLNHYF